MTGPVPPGAARDGGPPREVPVPPSTRLVADPGLRRHEDGRVLVGGSPLRLVRLSGAGAGVVARWLAGEPVGTGGATSRLARRLLVAGLVHPVPVRASPVAGPTPTEVTVVIPVRDDPAGLAATLASLVAAPPARIVIVDDGSTGPARVEPASAGAGVSLLRRARPGGPAAARNTGMAAVTTPVVAFLDAGVEVGDGWLEPLLAHLDDPAVGAAAPRVRSRPGPSTLARFERTRSPLDLGALPARVAPGSRVSYVPSAALVVRRDALLTAGGFDEGLRYGEDVDLVWRLVAAGWSVRYEPAAEVVHPPRPTWGAWARQRAGYGSAAAPLARRHPAALAPVRVSAWSAAAWALLVTRHPLPAAAVAAGTTALLPRKLTALARPWPAAVRLAATGHLGAGRLLAGALTRAWWPVTALATLAWPRSRLVVAAAAVVPPLLERRRQPSGERLDPLRYVALRVADDVAYGTGVWRGALRERTARPLVPDLGSWPGRSGAGRGAGPAAPTPPGA